MEVKGASCVENSYLHHKQTMAIHRHSTAQRSHLCRNVPLYLSLLLSNMLTNVFNSFYERLFTLVKSLFVATNDIIGSKQKRSTFMAYKREMIGV